MLDTIKRWLGFAPPPPPPVAEPEPEPIGPPPPTEGDIHKAWLRQEIIRYRALAHHPDYDSPSMKQKFMAQADALEVALRMADEHDI